MFGPARRAENAAAYQQYQLSNMHVIEPDFWENADG
jgi:hypothetical protein